MTKATKPGGRLDKVIKDKLVNLNHPQIKEYARLKQIDLPDGRMIGRAIPKKSTGVKKKTVSDDVTPVKLNAEKSETDIDDEDYGEYTLNQIADRFGTMTAFQAHLNSVKTIVDIETKRLSNLEKEKSLVPREFIAHFVFGPFEEGFSRLVTDAPQTIAMRLRDHYKAGGDIVGGEEIAAKIISQIVKASKNKAQRGLDRS